MISMLDLPNRTAIQRSFRAATRSRRLAWMLILAICGSVAPPARADQDLLQRLPDATRVLVQIEDYGAFVGGWQQTSLARLIEQGRFQPVQQQVEESLEGAGDLLSGLLLELSGDDLQRLSVNRLAWIGIEYGGRLCRIVTVDTRSTAREGMDAWLRAYALRQTQAGGQGDQRTVNGVTLYTWRFAETRRQRNVVVAQGRLWISDDPDCLASLVKPGGRQAALSDNVGWQTVQRSLQSGEPAKAGQLSWWADLRGLAALPPDSDAQAASLAKYRESGFQVIRSAGGTVRFGDDDWQTLARTFVYRDQPLQKAARMVSLLNGEIDPRTAIGHLAADGIGQFNVDWQAVLAGYASSFDQLYGDGEEGVFELVLDEIRDEPDAPQVDIRRDVFQRLGKPLTLVRGMGSGDLQPNSPARLFLVPVDRPRVVEKAVAKMMAGDPDVKRQRLGQQVMWQFQQLVKSDDQPVLGPNVSGWAIGVINDHLVVTNQLQLAQQLTTGRGQMDTDLLLSIRDEAARLQMPQLCAWQTFRLRSLADSFLARLSEASSGEPKDQDWLLRRFFESFVPGLEKMDWTSIRKHTELGDELGWGFQLIRSVENGWQLTSFTVSP